MNNLPTSLTPPPPPPPSGGSFLDWQRNNTYERYAERAAITAVNGEDFTECVRLNNLPTSITVECMRPRKGLVEETFRAQDIYRAWAKYERLHQDRIISCTLHGNAEFMTKGFVHWLTTEYTPRYRSITLTKDLDWLLHIAQLATWRRIMEAKLYNDAFADDYARKTMWTIRIAQRGTRNIAKLSHRLYRQYGYTPFGAQIRDEIVKAGSELHHMIMRGIRDNMPEPLPPLPKSLSTPRAFIMPPSEVEDDDDTPYTPRQPQPPYQRPATPQRQDAYMPNNLFDTTPDSDENEVPWWKH